MAASEYSGIPWSFTAHRWDIRENNLLKRKISHSRFARFISRRGIETARKLNALPSPTENVRLLYMGVRVEKDSVLRRTNETLTEDRFRIVCPANLLPIKGHEYLLRALCRLDNRQGLELWIAGDGPLETSLRQLTDALGLRDVVRFLGRLGSFGASATLPGKPSRPSLFGKFGVGVRVARRNPSCSHRSHELRNPGCRNGTAVA